MNIIFGKNQWEFPQTSMADFLSTIADAGFNAVETVVPSDEAKFEEFMELVAKHNLQVISAIYPGGATPEDHLASLEREYKNGLKAKPLLFNSHTASDLFKFEDNCKIFELGCALEDEYGITLAHETHRGRALFNLPITVEYLKAVPKLRLNADFSHWFCVHESDDLANQEEALEIAIQRSYHIHARVGYSQGPQVPNPLAPQWENQTARFVEIWKRILAARAAEGFESFTVTPEFGPVPYMQVEPFTGKPLADTWTVNSDFRKYLAGELV